MNLAVVNEAVTEMNGVEHQFTEEEKNFVVQFAFRSGSKEDTISLIFLSLETRSLHFLRRCLGFGTIRYPWSLQCLDSHRSVSRAEVPGQLLRVLSRSL